MPFLQENSVKRMFQQIQLIRLQLKDYCFGNSSTSKATNILMDYIYCCFAYKMDLSAPVLYNDKDIKIRQSGLTIKCYFFPIGTSKRIPISEIKSVEFINESSLRIWGTGTFKYWFALDSNRLSKPNFIAIDNGSHMKPAFTCTNNEQAYKILKRLVEDFKIKKGSQDEMVQLKLQ